MSRGKKVNARSAAQYEAPDMAVLGTVGNLTQGGYYNEYDEPGVRKTKGVTSLKKQRSKKRQKA